MLEMIQLVNLGDASSCQSQIKKWEKNGKFSAGLTNDSIRKQRRKNRWHKTVWDNNVIPRYYAITTMAIQGKLSTIDNLQKRNMQIAQKCVFCDGREKAPSLLVKELKESGVFNG